MLKILARFTILMCLISTNYAFSSVPDSLIKAIQRAEEKRALAMIAGTDLNAMDKDGNTALTSAAMFSAGITKALLEAKADPNLASRAGLTPLFLACRWGNTEAVNLLLKAGADVNKGTILGPALLGSYFYPSAPITRLLLEAGATFKEPVMIMNTISVYPFLEYLKTIKTPAEVVTYYGKIKAGWLKQATKFPDRLLNPKESDFSSAAEIAQVFLDKGMDASYVYEVEKVKITALEIAMESGLIEVAKLLLDRGATINTDAEFKLKDRFNTNALYPGLSWRNSDVLLASLLAGDLSAVKANLEKKPALLRKTYEGTGIIYCNDKSTGAIYSFKFKVKDMDLLMIAAEHGKTEIVNYLLQQGAFKEQAATAEWEAGTDKTVFCNLKLTQWPMAFAKNSGNEEIVKLFKTAGYIKE